MKNVGTLKKQKQNKTNEGTQVFQVQRNICINKINQLEGPVISAACVENFIIMSTNKRLFLLTKCKFSENKY